MAFAKSAVQSSWLVISNIEVVVMKFAQATILCGIEFQVRVERWAVVIIRRVWVGEILLFRQIARVWSVFWPEPVQIVETPIPPQMTFPTPVRRVLIAIFWVIVGQILLRAVLGVIWIGFPQFRQWQCTWSAIELFRWVQAISMGSIRWQYRSWSTTFEQRHGFDYEASKSQRTRKSNNKKCS